MKGKIVALVCSLTLLTGSLPAMAGGAVLYDETAGESLSSLLEETVEVWETMAVPTEAAALDVKAKGAVLMDQGTGKVLYEKNSRAHLPIASITKVMTLLLTLEAIEAGKLNWTDTVTCSERAASMGGSQIWLEPGEVMTVEELVKAAVVVSANDACTALGEHISGSLEGFVEAMNRRAGELGMENTQFKDCSGLDDTGYSCAYDVALMSRELIAHKEIQRFTTIWTDTLRGGKSQLVNTNKLMRHYQGATGLKTGTTGAAGHCLSATATREGTSFVAVVLGCDSTADRWAGARSLLDYGFGHYVTYTPSTEGLILTPVEVLKGQQTTVEAVPASPAPLLLEKGTEGQVTAEVELAADVEAPVLPGQVLGCWRLRLGEEILAEYPLLAAHEVPKTTLKWAYGQLMDALLA